MRLSPESLSLVVEIQDGDTLHRAYIISSSRAQFYRTTDLHVRDHFQLCGEEALSEYKRKIKQKGLQEVDPDIIDAQVYIGTPCFSVLSGNRNHFLHDLVVVNFIDDRELLELALKTKLTELGVHLLETSPQDKSLKKSEDRGNFRCDIGFTPKSNRDKSVFKGMNVPYFTTWSDKVPGIEGDCLTVSMIKAACAMTEFVEAIKTKFLLPWNDFSGEARRNYFTRRVAKSHNIADYKNFLSEGVTASVTGPMPDGTLKLLTRHRDRLNGRFGTHNMYRGLSFTVDLVYAGCHSPVPVRFSLGDYGKECIDQACARVMTCGKLLRWYGEWRDENQDLFMVKPEVLLSSVSKVRKFTVCRPKADKSVYYSIFIHGIMILGQRTHFDKAILFEAVMAMALTPSPSAWFCGLMHAESVRGTGNLIVSFIDHMVSTHKSVSAGRYRRRQVSTGGEMLWKELWASLRNMMTLVDRAASTDFNSTDHFIASWGSQPDEGGVKWAGDLVSQEQVYVFTALTLIKTVRHVNNTFVGKNNRTAERLRELGLKEHRHRVEFVRVVSQTYGISTTVAENSICEWLRELRGSDGKFFDTIHRGQKLYAMNGYGDLLAYDRHGMVEKVALKDWRFDAVEYDDGVRWWDLNFDIESTNGKVILSTNTKKAKKNVHMIPGEVVTPATKKAKKRTRE